jgi:GT2 family glycosyltransferase
MERRVDSAEAVRPAGSSAFTGAAWLGDELLLVVAHDAAPVEVVLDGGERVAAESLGPDEGETRVYLARCPTGRTRALAGRGGSGDDGGTPLDEITTETATLAAGLATLDPRSRTALVERLQTGAAPERERGDALVCRHLFTLREALRERLPPSTDQPGEPRGVHVESILRIDERSFYIGGWLHDEPGDTARLTAVSPEGERVELLERVFRYPRPDVGEHFAGQPGDPRGDRGFLAFFQTRLPSLHRRGWLVETESSSGTANEARAREVVSDPDVVRDAILADPFRSGAPNDELMEKQIAPAIARVQERMLADAGISSVTEHGVPAESPHVSIVVPLYRRLDYVEAQLAEFANDPDIRTSDLIYVLDSPEQANELLHGAAQLFRIYRVPFRVAIMNRNVGFAGANNAGASIGRGRLLVLLNSDVVPVRPGWLRAMCSFYDDCADIGALGPKLLYEDDTIQHAGMYFYRRPDSTVWQDAHYFKGLHLEFPEANVTRPVPAVSGACLMIERALYERLELRGIYARGGFEDYDLCMRLLEEGRRNWYLPTAELYHLEAQSFAGQPRQLANRFNMWLHTHLWRERIEALMEERPP